MLDDPVPDPLEDEPLPDALPEDDDPTDDLVEAELDADVDSSAVGPGVHSPVRRYAVEVRTFGAMGHWGRGNEKVAGGGDVVGTRKRRRRDE